MKDYNEGYNQALDDVKELLKELYGNKYTNKGLQLRFGLYKMRRGEYDRKRYQ